MSFKPFLRRAQRAGTPHYPIQSYFVSSFFSFIWPFALRVPDVHFAILAY